MFLEAGIVAWSGLALLWWMVSWSLVRAHGGAAPPIEKTKPVDADEDRLLTVFKPLPQLNAMPFDGRGIESFLAQLDADAELLLGVHEADRAQVEPWLARMQRSHPHARLRVIWRTEPCAMRNPKVAWLKILAPHAKGELWLWSDADIYAPPGFLRTAREEYATGGARLLTSPYVVRDFDSGPAVLDALYVNVEFFPGVLFLRGLGPVDFGLGAAMLFARADFDRSVDWTELGAALADDFVLGQKLRPVRIGRAELTTHAAIASWGEAVGHYLRWNKTVRWNRPGGTAARIIVLPLLGWLALAMARPESAFAWLGLAAMIQADVLAATLICRRIGCRLGWRDLPALEFWSVGRAVAWVICWLPWPVVWSRRSWWRPIDKT
jgi:ceramide glucosyltransferase